MPHFQKTTEEMVSFRLVPIYLVMELFLHARMLDVSAALLTFTSQGISVLKPQWHVTNFMASIRKKMKKCFFFFYMAMSLKKSKDQCRVSSSSLQIIKSVHVLHRTDIMPCEELVSQCISSPIQSKSKIMSDICDQMVSSRKRLNIISESSQSPCILLAKSSGSAVALQKTLLADDQR